MSVKSFLSTPLAARSSRIESERAVLAFFTRARDAAPSQTDAGDPANSADSISFSIAQISAGTGLDRRSVIEACAVLADGWARDNVPPGREPRLVPVLAPVGDCDGSDIHYALNGAKGNKGSVEGGAR